MRQLLALALFLFATSAFAWTSHGPTGGSVIASAQAPSDPRVLYVTTSAGILRSGTRTAAGGSVIASAAAPSDSRVLYITTSAGVLRSDDAGASWRDVTNGVAGARYVAVDPADANRVYVTTATGVARSSDGGMSWTVATIAPSGFPTTGLEVDRLDSNVLYTGGHCDAELFPSAGSGFFRSADRGATWSFVATPGGAGCITELALDPLSSTVYAEEDDGPSLRLQHGSATFEKQPAPRPTRAIVVDPRNSSVRYGISSFYFSLIASTDGGATWGLVGSRVVGTFNTLAVDPATGRLFLGTSSGLYRSGNGGQSWASVDNLPQAGVTSITIAPGSIAVGTGSGVFRTTDAMATWTRVDTGDIGTSIADMAADPSDPASVYVRSWSGSLFHTSDFGNSWTYFGELPGAHLVVDAGGQLYAVLDHDLYRRDGDGWDHILHLPDRIAAFVPDAQVPGTLWLRGEYQLRVTHDRGQSFEDLPSFGQSSYAVVADPRRSNVLYALYGLYRSADGGLTWTKLDAEGVPLSYVAPPASDPSFVYTWSSDELARVTIAGGAAKIGRFPDHVNALVVDPRDANTLYIATAYRGIFRSTDGGVTWTNIGDLAAWRLAIDSSGLVLHAGSTGLGVWEQRLARPRAVRQR